MNNNNNNGHTSFRPRNSPNSSDRFLDLFSKSQPANPTAAVVGDEFEEDDVFWTGNFSESDRRSDTPQKVTDQNHRPSSLRRVDSSGIRAALHGYEQKRSPSENRLLCRKISFPSSSSSRMIPAIPKAHSHEREYQVSVSAGNYRHSAPVNVPVRPRGSGREAALAEMREDDGERMPPHEIVARASSQAEMTFSVLEGVGRTLKGRDLRQVRNAVWRQTGFLD